jgi:hypothetical protein
MDLEEVLRRRLFHQLDGIVAVPTLSAFSRNGLLSDLLKNGHIHIRLDPIGPFRNPGYLNVAARFLECLGWVERKFSDDGLEISVFLTDSGRQVSTLRQDFEFFAEMLNLVSRLKLLFENRLEVGCIQKMTALSQRFHMLTASLATLDSELSERLRCYLEGVLCTPILLLLRRENRISLEDGVLRIGDLSDENRQIILKILKQGRWMEGEEECLNEAGQFFSRKAHAYAIILSYFPMLSQLEEVLFGESNRIFQLLPEDREGHIDRELNVWGTGLSHGLYFRSMKSAVTEIFQAPEDQRPLGIADMGCGDGSLLESLWNALKEGNLIGADPQRNPILVGADLNPAARDSTRMRMKRAGIEAMVVPGDISHPAEFAKRLRGRGLNLVNLLSVRSFLDHDRALNDSFLQRSSTDQTTSGAYSRGGKYIAPAAVYQDLVEHMRSWTPFVANHGLLVLELHCLNPELSNQSLGRVASPAYEAIHGYSDQYILEHETYLRAIQQAGLIPIAAHSRIFPSNALPVISLHHFKEQPA